MNSNVFGSRLIWAGTIFAGLVLFIATARGTEAPLSGADEVSVMTFNLRFASERPPNAWPDRRPVVRDCIRQVAPDLIGTQEGVYPQLKDMAADLPEYDWIGLGRDGGSRGEFMAVFYRRERFEPIEYEHFWLSDTPEVMGSATWGHSNRRMVTWIKFRDRDAGREFYLWNTHFDHQNQEAREKSARLVLERVNELGTGLPVILVGDFNATAGRNKVYDTLVNDRAFADTWRIARERRGEIVKTFHNYLGPVAGDDRIDWILIRGPVNCHATEIVTYHRDGQYPSDHFPVVAWLRWGGLAP
jgi:endonuclease/exonuclease/phosphatase family metal-dependent hydrolase